MLPGNIHPRHAEDGSVPPFRPHGEGPSPPMSGIHGIGDGILHLLARRAEPSTRRTLKVVQLA